MDDCKVVISRTNSQDPEKRGFEEALAEKCAARGLEAVLLPDVYHLRDPAPLLEAFGDSAAPAVFFSWYQPRAAFWILRKLGVTGKRAESFEGASASDDERLIVCRNLSDKCCPDRWVEHLAELLGGTSPGGAAAVRRIDGTLGERWYPVIDYDRCTSCLQCLEFCLFGVFETDDDGRVTASSPDACKPGCPACSRVCPNQAIMFPLYDSDPGIAGSDDAEIKPFSFDAAQLEKIKKDFKKGKLDIAAMVKACGCDAKALRAAGRGGSDCACNRRDPNADDRGNFDKLIDRLVED